ncbi:hypothetical protein DQT32_04355 [Salmonella enterica subsp. enterica serovar Braenderup]|nr:hypothetical protein [Salmonella enterica subsp. enterica serovar Braenderup]
MRQFAIYDRGSDTREHPLTTKAVLETIPDLTDNEVERIIDLNKSEVIDLDNGNIIIVRTA